MKKLAAIGALCLALGMASCKTYCPAYNYAQVEVKAKQTVTASDNTKAAATDEVNS